MKTCPFRIQPIKINVRILKNWQILNPKGLSLENIRLKILSINVFDLEYDYF